VHLPLASCTVRDWRASDATSLARHANDRRIWINLRDLFPHPYSLTDAERYITAASKRRPATHYAIEVDGQAAGGIGYAMRSDVERISAEIGYWLGAAFWGRGVMTEALTAVTRSAFAENVDLRRVFAVPFAWNAASIRVLEKVGYQLEGRMRQSAVKDGQIVDQLLYAMLRDDLGAR
jgi:RimJ/RimL family protein N-acetyltransferase